MNGSIGVDSQSGRGSQFWFELPLPIASEIVESNDRNVAKALTDHITSLKRPVKLLVVDDNEINRLVISKLLSSFNIEISEASGGASAIDLASRMVFDVIFMDIQMPDIDGFAATRAIRQSHLNANVPIVAFTASAFGEDRAACLSATMNGFVTKPVDKGPMLEVLLASLKQGDTINAEDSMEFSIVPSLPDAEKPIFDRGACDNLLAEIGLESVCLAYNLFVDDTRAAILNVFGHNDRKAIQIKAHTLKSSAGTFGFARLAQAAARVEAISHDMSEAEIQSSICELADLFDRSMEAFNIWRSEEQSIKPRNAIPV